MPGRPTTLAYGRAGACCACSRSAFKNASARVGARWDQNGTVERQFALAQYFIFYFFQFLMGYVMDIYDLYQYITKFN